MVAHNTSVHSVGRFGQQKDVQVPEGKLTVESLAQVLATELSKQPGGAGAGAGAPGGARTGAGMPGGAGAGAGGGEHRVKSEL